MPYPPQFSYSLSNKLKSIENLLFDRTNSSRQSTSSSTLTSSTSWTTSKVLGIECIRGTSRADEWSDRLLQTGDMAEEIQIGDLVLRSSFKEGNSGVYKQLHSCFMNKLTAIRVQVRSGEFDSTECSGSIVPKGRKKQYLLRAIDNPNYAVASFDCSEHECLNLQGISRLFRTMLLC